MNNFKIILQVVIDLQVFLFCDFHENEAKVVPFTFYKTLTSKYDVQ